MRHRRERPCGRRRGRAGLRTAERLLRRAVEGRQRLTTTVQRRMGRKAATAPGTGPSLVRRQAADPGFARKPGGGNLVGSVTFTPHPMARKDATLRGLSAAIVRARSARDRRGTRTDGQMSSSTHASQRGLLGVADPPAVQDHPQAEPTPLAPAAGSVQLELDLHRIVLGRSAPGAATSRPTWVSTGRPGRPNATLRTTLPVLRPTPGSVTRSSSSVGTSPSKRSTQRLGHADQAPRLVPVEAGRADDLLDARPDRPRRGRAASGSGRTAPASPC